MTPEEAFSKAMSKSEKDWDKFKKLIQQKDYSPATLQVLRAFAAAEGRPLMIGVVFEQLGLLNRITDWLRGEPTTSELQEALALRHPSLRQTSVEGLRTVVANGVGTYANHLHGVVVGLADKDPVKQDAKSRSESLYAVFDSLNALNKKKDDN